MLVNIPTRRKDLIERKKERKKERKEVPGCTLKK